MPINNGFQKIEHNSPLTVPGVMLYYDDSDRNNFEFNIGDQVSKWYDLSGNNNDATQTTSANQPLYTNGELTFDGTNSYLNCPLTYDWNNNNFTIYTVQENDTAVNNFRGVFGNRFGAGQANWFTIGHTPFGDKFIMEYTAGVVFNPNPLFADALQPAFITTVIKENTPLTTIRINDGSENTTSASYNSGGVTNSVTIGQWLISTQRWFGKIGVIIVIDGKVTTAQNTNIINYLKNKRGIA